MNMMHFLCLVLASDGVVRSGTFLIIHSQLERLKTEGVVDVFQAIKSACIHSLLYYPLTQGFNSTYSKNVPLAQAAVYILPTQYNSYQCLQTVSCYLDNNTTHKCTVYILCMAN